MKATEGTGHSPKREGEMSANRLPVFDRFIQDLRRIWASTPEVERRMTKAKKLLETLLADAEIKAHSRNWPTTEGQNLLFYEDPDYGFVINGVVHQPNRKGHVHDHAQAWVLYGLLDGTETLERYERTDGGVRPGYAKLNRTHAHRGTPGFVDLIPPFSPHAEQGGPGRSVAVIVRSERLVGRTRQHRYDPDIDGVEERWGPEQVPYEITR